MKKKPYFNDPNHPDPPQYERKEHSLDLRFRIVDKGFTIRTMPSVKRPPTSSSQSRPLSAKIFSLKNKLAPVIYQQQSSILHLVQGENQAKVTHDALKERQMKDETHITENQEEQKDEINALTKINQISYINKPSTVARSEAALQRNFLKSSGGVGFNPFENQSNLPMDRGFSNERKIYTSQTNLGFARGNEEILGINNNLNLGSNINTIVTRNQSAGQLLNPLSNSYLQKLGVTMQGGFFKPRTITEDMRSSLISAGINDADFKRSKYLVDKISGKFRMDKRYGHMINPIKTPGANKLSLTNEDLIKTSTQQKSQTDDPGLIAPSAKKNMLTTCKRPASRIDKYIDLILKNVTNLDEFIYLVKVGEDDPYYLDVIDYEKIKAKQIKEYYTISKKGLCHYDNGKPLEFIVLANWLKERETYDQIKSLTFFTKFRKWKTLKMWKRHVIGHKTQNYKRVLEEKLFILNPTLRSTLLIHRKNCCDMEKLRFIDLNQQQYGLSADIPKLEEFKSMQEKKRKQVNEKIQEFSKKCRENIRDGFKSSLDSLRKNQYSTAFEDDFAKRNENTNLFRLKESAYENLGFPENLSYEKRSELRKQCSKFLRFSYLVDFLAMEALKNIYVLSVEDLIYEFNTLVKSKDGVIYRDKNQKGSSKIKEPMFFLSVDCHFQQEISENDLETTLIPEFYPPPAGKHKTEEDFNILYHVYCRPPKEKKEKKEKEKPKGKGKKQEESDSEDSDDEKHDIIDENKTYTRQICSKISRLWLSLRPNLDSFFSDIVRCLGEGMNAIQAFERWSRHDEMTPYVSVLEEWDDMVGDDWEMPDSNYLDPQDWLLENSPLEKYSRDLKVLLEEAFERAEKYLDGFGKYLTIYWENSRVNLEIFKSELLVRQAESIQYTLTLLNHQKDLLEQELPFQADLGLFRIDSNELRKELLPSPENLIKKLQSFLPDLLKVRNKAIKEWLFSCNQALKSGTGNLEEFVKQRNALKLIEKEYPKIKIRLDTLSSVCVQLKEFKFEFKKDDEQAFIDTIHLMTALSGTMNTSNEAIEKGLENNALKISKKLIPEFEKTINELDFKVKDGKYLSKEISEENAIKELGELIEAFKKLEDEGNKYREYQRTLGMDESDFENLRSLKEDLDLRFSMWKSLREWKDLTKSWIDGKFNEIDTDQIISKGDYFTNIIKKSQKKLTPNPILDELRDIVYKFKDTMPVVIALRNKHLKEHHWKDIKEKIGQDFDIDDDFKLSDLIAMNVEKCMKEIQEISVQATQEAILEKQFNEITTSWQNLEFTVVPYKSDKAKELFVLTEMDELFAQIDEYLANLNNILGSRYLKLLRPKAEELHKKLLYTQETIDDWLICQKNWIYLENIFDSPDIKKKLSGESNAFEGVDKNFRIHMRKAQLTRIVSKCVTNDLGKIFKRHKDTLSGIQKALEAYLEQKRISFPRFYFLSNDELLEILAKAQDLQAIQKHMKKCFDNIYKLDIGDQETKSTSISGMISAEGERVELTPAISTRQAEVENWLNLLQDRMRDTISKNMKKGKMDIDNPITERKNWVLEHSGQVISVISQITWCANTEYFLDQMGENPNSMAEWYQINFVQLSQLTELVRKSLDDVKHKIIVALITQDVHARDIIETLTNENVNSKTDFLWQQQLRYYWDENVDKENVYVLQVNARIKYGYEYMGATSRLVITPLTDRCWITITGALNIKLGAAPAGPAGTGKTESTKDLAKALGNLCVVFNCSEQIEYKMMARLFSGLVQQGAWSCLDEFNRIDIEVLSVIAQQLGTIRHANLRGDKKFLFYGTTEIIMREGFGVFITMNPGYAGRTELPDNLKVLFRPVSMMIPDYRLIAEIILFSEGFENSKVLSNKMVQLYKLSSEQLSQQKHYDFGMRAVKSVLVMAGSLKRADPNCNEDGVLIKAMRDSNIPKFLKEDIPLFQALIQDLFPDVLIPTDDYSVLSKTIENVYKELGLQKVDKLTTKVIQLFETFNVRFGVMIVGFTGSAKTTCYQILQNAMTTLRKTDSTDKRYQTVHTHVLNPKCITMGELYGEVNKFTEEWNDGLASFIMREAATDEAPDRKNDRHWVVFDGPVDALWIENMNTVLDDNMMLCLANGQRIKLRSEMRMLFEVNDLQVASPATVSRCGMVYMTFEEIGWKPYVLSWLEKLYNGFAQEELLIQQQHANNSDIVINEYFNKELKAYFWTLFEDYVDDGLSFLRNGSFVEPIATVDIQIISSFCNLLDCFLNKSFGFKPNEKFENKKRFLALIFAFSYIWSFGTTIYEEYHHKFDDFMRKKFSGILFPNTDNIYGFYLDNSAGDFVFKSWNDITQDFVYDKDIPYFNLLVPTIDTVRYSFIMEWLLIFNKKIFVTGGTGTGKSVIVKTLLRNIQEPRMIDTIFLMFSAATDSLITQMTIEGKLERYKKTLIGAKAGHKMVIFIDDINMPAVEKYGAQPPIELLRLMIDKGGLYDRKDPLWKEIQNTTFLAAAAPPTGGRNEMTPRFTRHFNLLCVPQPNQKILFKIFNSILSGFLNTGFPEALKRSSDNITLATIDVYTRIIKEKKAIPSKFHYTFNLRDVSKVIQGISMTRGGIMKEQDQMVRLWIHEVSRVFYDRLINEEDRDWFRDLICELLGRHFNTRWSKEEIFINNSILFGDILKLDSNKDYEEIKDLKKLTRVLEDRMDDHNGDQKNKSKLNLVFFEDAIEHILRIARVLRQPRGNLMLIGVGGSGKQSLTRLSSYLLNYQIKQVEIVKGYNQQSFRDFLRELLNITGVDGLPLTFLFNDTQIIQESFLEDINNMLNSGEVPNIWEQPDDKEKIINSVRSYHVNDLKKPDAPDLIYATFVDRVRDNLHIVLCMSPVGDALRIRCRKFPSLVDCCTLDWFSAWPEAALLSVSTKLLSEFNMPSEEVRKGLAEMCKEVHVTSGQLALKFDQQLRRKVYTTPKSYLDLILLYIQTLDEKREEISFNSKRLSSGLNKLHSANDLVANLKISLTELQPQLAEQSKKVDEALVELEKDSLIAREQEMEVERDREEINNKTHEIKRIADDAKQDLDQVQPELDAADKAIKEIDKPSLVQIKSYPNPPKIVQDVMEGLCILYGKKYEWNVVTKMMQDLNGFINDLLNFPKDTIKEDVLNKFRKHRFNPTVCFKPDDIKSRASAAADICVWCIAMDTYCTVNKKVGPKRAKVQQLQAKLDESNKILAEKEAEVNKVKDKVAKLKHDSDEMVQKKIETEKKIETTVKRLKNAESLTYLLKEEGERWAESIKRYESDIITVVGDVFLATACISYLGPFTGVYRQELTSKWITMLYDMNIPISSETVSTTKTLGNPVVLRDWMMNGLPSDNVSQENAIFATKGYKWPLMIDPQLQANKWIKKTEEANGIKVMKFSDTQFQVNMRAAITIGFPVLIQDTEETLDPMLDSIFAKNFITSNDGRVLIRFADADLDYNNMFRLYMTTKKPNPNYLPEIFIKVNVINFTVTFEGLEEQLLADVVKKEQPEIELQRDKNIVELADFRKKILENETNILKLLAKAKSDTLLDDENLINTLQTSKTTSHEIQKQIKVSTELEKTIDTVRNQYKDVSIRGSILYFVIKDLALIDPMYQYSLQYITRLFNSAIDASAQSDDLPTRIANLIDTITKTIFTNVCRGLFEAHTLIYSFLIATNIKRQAKILNDSLWGVFLRGAGLFDKENQPNNPDPLIPSIGWDLAYYLDINFDIFKGLTNDIKTKWTNWKVYATALEPLEEKLPGDWEEKFDDFEKLFMLKIFRPEKLMFAIANYVEANLEKFYLESPGALMSNIYADSDNKTPIIFVLSQGADPTDTILNFAKERQFEDQLKVISLGQGQGPAASELIKHGRTEGNWVFLQNCHLAKTFMPGLELIIEDIYGMTDIHQNFRLFLTSMPADYFPVSILQNGIKLTTEPPRGMKANMKRAFNGMTQEFMDSCNKGNTFHKMLWGLAFFHSMVLERRKFGPLGWNIKYEFNDSDLSTSRTVLLMLLNEQEQIPWDALLFVTGHINYGGRVTDDWDRRCLISILKKFYIADILEEKYQFSDSEAYYVPPIGTIEEYKDYIEKMPITDDPEVFGMHENANINYQAQESDKIIQTILSIQPRLTTSGSGKSNDEIILELVKEISQDVPEDLLKDKGNAELFVENEMNLIPSLSTVLLQEMDRFNTLLSKMRSSLVNLSKAIQGFGLMSQELDSMYYSLLNNQVPKLWEEVAYPSLKPLASWITDLKERVKFMSDWLLNGNPNCFWISGFYFPQGFLTGVLQTHARKYKIPIDQLQFTFRIMEDKESIFGKPQDGVYINGFYLEGASLEKKKKILIDQYPGEMYFKMPVIHFNPVDNYEAKTTDYICPVYKTSLRHGVLSTTGQSTNFILPVDIPTNDENTEYWTLRGTAMITQLNT